MLVDGDLIFIVHKYQWTVYFYKSRGRRRWLCLHLNGVSEWTMSKKLFHLLGGMNEMMVKFYLLWTRMDVRTRSRRTCTMNLAVIGVIFELVCLFAFGFRIYLFFMKITRNTCSSVHLFSWLCMWCLLISAVCLISPSFYKLISHHLEFNTRLKKLNEEQMKIGTKMYVS